MRSAIDVSRVTPERVRSAVQRVKAILDRLALELRPEAPRERLLRRCRKAHSDSGD